MSGHPRFLRGAYSHPGTFWATGARLDEYGIDAVFVHSQSIDAELVSRARAEGAMVFAEFATLNGKGYVDAHPEAWPVNERGEQAQKAGWFMGACPTDPGFRAHRLQALEDLIERYAIDGVWMDYLHWHAHFEDPIPVLPETCFSETCIDGFSNASGVSVPRGSTSQRARSILDRHETEWRDWRCSVLADWASAIREVTERIRPGIRLGNFQCPWRDEEFGSARRRTLGLDIHQLATLVDVMSPMVYHGRMGRSAGWVRESVEWLVSEVRSERLEIWPIVQAGDPQHIPADQFREVMINARAAGATGVMMFHIEAIAEDPAKMAALRDLYTSWA